MNADALVHVFVGSLYTAAVDIVSYGLCNLFNAVAQAIPDNSTFFMSYMLTETLLIVPLLDFLQARASARGTHARAHS
eukprot:6181209-Pleurochrysis_carterae.AAC.2